MSMIGTSMRRRRQARLLLATVAAVASASAAWPDAAAAAGAMAAMGGSAAVVRVAAKEVTVTIDHHAFVPAKLEIAPGTTVTWKNADDSPHTVRARNQAFASAALDSGDSYKYTFATPGDFAYFCSLHPFMVGEIVVAPAGKS